MHLTDQILDLAGKPSNEIPLDAKEKAALSLLDWIVCGLAGKREPVAVKLRELARQETGSEVATLIGGGKVPARMAALVNGATSHALDYDDTHFAHVGHLSVGIYPAALAVAEEVNASAQSMVEAFLIGAEAAIRIGVVLGTGHYNRGFHQTATAGAFGATVASARLYQLSRQEIQTALGLCATRASGVKSQFGTMGKPYNAGIAASNGVECAILAKLGFTSVEDGLMDPQGFIPTHADMETSGPSGLPFTDEGFLFNENKYKFHACCHGTHAMIEALHEANLSGKGLDNVATVEMRVNPRWLKVCDYKKPKTGLEVKFSYAWLAGMTLRGDNTRNEQTYTDALSQDPELAGFAKRITVVGDNTVKDMQTEGNVTLTDGTIIPFRHDLEAEISNQQLEDKLVEKAVALLGDKGLVLKQQLARLHALSAGDIGAIIATETD